MSRGRNLMLLTILMHLAGLALSYLYGEIIPAGIGGILPDEVGVVRVATFWLYSRPIMLLPHSIQPAFLHHPGFTWLSLAVFIQLCYLLRHLRHRLKKRDLGVSYPGNPGGQYWENVQHRIKDYREATLRWNPRFVLKTPTWYYYKRQESNQPDMYWRGHKLIIEKELLKAERVQDLTPMLARKLMYYNCDDVAFKDILAYYPDRFSRWQLLLHLSGLCIFLPVMLIQWFFWPSYWTKRRLVADKFAYCLGQGHLLYFHIQVALQQEEHSKRKRREVIRAIQELEERLRMHPDNYNRLAHHLMQLRQWEQLLQKEQQTFEVHPMLEQRREQLVALLGTEQTWMEQRGISPPVQATPLPPTQETHRLQGRTDQSNGKSQTHVPK